MSSWRSSITCAVALAVVDGCAGRAASGSDAHFLAPTSSATAAPPPPQQTPLATCPPPPSRGEPPPDPPAPLRPTIVQEPYLGRELNLSEPLAPDLASTPSLLRGLAPAQELVANLERQVRSGRWSMAVRTGCPLEYNGDVIVEGRAVVRDGAGNVRGYAESPGTGDFAGVWKLYYDRALHLRVAAFSWHSVAGQAVDGVMLFDANGRLERCATQPADASATYCEARGTPVDDEMDPAVADAVRPEVASRARRGVSTQTPATWLAKLDPTWEFQKCDTPYTPSR
jgi:hypothetical protein